MNRTLFVKKRLKLFLSFFLIASGCFAASSIDYYVKDSVGYYGVRLLDYGLQNNCQACVVLINKAENVEKSYSPKEVSEYGIGAELSYVAKDIFLNNAWKRVFLERKMIGAITLYHYRDAKTDLFYLQRDSGLLIELPKKSALGNSFRAQLADYTKDCSVISATNIPIGYTMRSITKYLKRYQSCTFIAPPKFRAGVSIGLGFTKLVPSPLMVDPDIRNFQFHYDEGTTLGFFVDQPLFRSNFSLHASCDLTQVAFSYTHQGGQIVSDLAANVFSLELPIQLRYVFPLKLIRPYLEVGGLASWNFLHENAFREINVYDRRIELIRQLPTNFIDAHYLGFSIGGGAEMKINSNHWMHLTLRYDRSKGLSDNSFVGFSRYNLTTGFTF